MHTCPGVYIEIEGVPSGVRTIIGVATSITAFIGRASRGPVGDPTCIQRFTDFEREFGGLSIDSTMSYAVQQYFLNGGTDAIIVRVVHSGDANADANSNKASLHLPGPDGALELEAANEGIWGNELRARVDYATRDPEPGENPDSLFNLAVRDMGTNATESFRDVSTDPNNRRFVTRVLEQGSTLVRVSALGTVPAQRPSEHPPAPTGEDPFEAAGSHAPSNNDGSDGDAPTANDIQGEEDEKTGVFALEKADLFNLLCIPPIARDGDVLSGTLVQSLAYCKKRRAMLIVDPPVDWDSASDVTNSASGVDSLGLRDENAAIYFPRVRMPDPLKENRLEEFVPCGVVAGIMARTDAQRGVFKAPAGIEAILAGVQELTVKLTDAEQVQLNALGVNCLRNFPDVGNVVWGARTLEGADRSASEWKYVPVRRMALFLEETLYRNLKWVVFEPNDEPLWAQIRFNIGAFMQNLFRQGAFQGTSPREAYFVKCDKETTTQNDINRGIVNVLVGFAPLKPAEFVILKIQQIAGEVQT
jgi:phage tail sheath protein FI